MLWLRFTEYSGKIAIVGIGRLKLVVLKLPKSLHEVAYFLDK
jgi:hypothetical protein